MRGQDQCSLSHTRTHAHTHSISLFLFHTHVHTCTHAHTHTDTCTHTFYLSLSFSHTRTHMHTCTHTHGHMHVQKDENTSRQLQKEAIVVAMNRRDAEAFSALSHAATLGDVEEVYYMNVHSRVMSYTFISRMGAIYRRAGVCTPNGFLTQECVRHDS